MNNEDLFGKSKGESKVKGAMGMKIWMVGVVILFSFAVLQGCTYYDKDEDQTEFNNESSSTFSENIELIEP